MTSTEPRRAAPAAQPALPIQLADAALAVRGAGVVAGGVRGLGRRCFRAGGGAGNLRSPSRVFLVAGESCLGRAVPDVSHWAAIACGRIPRQAGRRSICENNLRQIALALQNYHQANGCFPPAYVADKNGKPMHSSRMLILPYVGFDDLYKAYDFTEPWDGPNNKKTESAAKRNLGTKGKSHVNEPVLRKSVVRCDLACRALRRFVLGPWGWRRPCRWQRPWRWWRPCRWWLSRRRRRDACRLL